MMNFLKKLFNRPKPEKMIAVDVELDGLHPSHIIQLSYLVIEGRKVKGKNFYFRARAINRYARQVHQLVVKARDAFKGADGAFDEFKLVEAVDLLARHRFYQDGAVAVDEKGFLLIVCHNRL